MDQNLSICVNVKDRSRGKCSGRSLTLFPDCVSSLVHSLRENQLDRGQVQLSVVDWASIDWPLVDWLDAAVAGSMEVKITPLDGKFSRGGGRNKAAEVARHDNLFFLDADMLVVPEVIREGMECLRRGIGYFPIPWGYSDQSHTETYQMDLGTGNCFITRGQWKAVGGFPERTTWGFEDTDFWERVKEISVVHRPSVPKFLHQWHPNGWRWRHGTDQENEQYQSPVRRASQI